MSVYRHTCTLEGQVTLFSLRYVVQNLSGMVGPTCRQAVTCRLLLLIGVAMIF
jgi:hypothetical protein